ncbi:MAG TPA: c-type cytochrome [Phycisphaerales bacterium]|nr:c-type cytochrome [Phycisphaerales bacterium]
MRLALALLLASAPALAQRGDHAGEPQPALPPDLRIPEAPALTPAQELATFRLAEPTLTISLAAAEPLIVAPVSAVFDADGRLWVVEMQSYMPDIDGENELAPNSRVVVLEDLDHDWEFDKATTFLDGLTLPRSVLPCYGGALVLAPPDLIFARDTNGDGRADEQRTLLGGFGGLDNPEHAGNGLLYGLDNWIHLSQHNLELRFDGERVVTRPVPGHGQWGITQDRWGRLYYCPNSDVLRADLFPKHYAARNPNQRGVQGMNADVAPDKSVYPARMNPGINRGYQDHMLRDDYTLAATTAACSPIIYDSRALGPAFRADAFVCEPAGNCVLRVKLDDADGVPAARRAYPDTEFLTSTDERFRPVALAAGPDGSLFVADMYRGVIQHKTYVTTFLRTQVEDRALEKPVNLGRIWRIAPPVTFSSGSVRLSAASDADLVKLLASDEASRFGHAQKLLVERRALSVADDLRELVADPRESPHARARAAWTLEGLGALQPADAAALCTTGPAELRRTAARLLDRWPDDADAVAALTRLAGDPDRFVRIQAALSLGESRLPQATEALARALLAGADDPVLRSAVISGCREREVLVLDAARTFPAADARPARRDALAELASTSLRASPAQRTRYLDLVAECSTSQRWLARLLLERLAAELQLDSDRPATLGLAAEPRAWSDALSRGLWDMHARALAVTARLRWPGHDSGAPALAPLSPAQRDLFRRGQRLFDVCAACHGFDGRGLAGQAPPLAGSALATGPESRAIRVLLHGLEGPITRDGVDYNAQMPAAPFHADEDVAAVLTYIRRSFGNTADPVSPEAVARTRAETRRSRPWTEGELLNE